jgi:ABC-type microcin C transport system permease subunit YejB
MLESETLPKKFVIPIIFLILIALLIPVGNLINNSQNNDSEEEKWNSTIVIAVFALSFALSGIILYVVVNNPSLITENNELDESISFAEREQKINSKK